MILPPNLGDVPDTTHQPSKSSSYAARSKLRSVSASTLWRHERGHPSRADKAQKQQYLTPCEEKALVTYVLRSARNGYSLPVKFLRSLATVIKRQRNSTFQASASDLETCLPGVNWPQGFYRRHSELVSRRMWALDWTRYDRSIGDKVVELFDVIMPELRRPDVQPENAYNMYESGVLLDVLQTLKVLVGKSDL